MQPNHFGVRKDLRPEALQAQQKPKRITHGHVVVHDENRRIRIHAPTSLASRIPKGIEKAMQVPLASERTSHRRPSFASTKERQIASPKPMPADFVEVTGRKI
jgi:hypothetical protein